MVFIPEGFSIITANFAELINDILAMYNWLCTYYEWITNTTYVNDTFEDLIWGEVVESYEEYLWGWAKGVQAIWATAF